MGQAIKLLDALALLEDRVDAGLRRGQVGTVVEELAPDVYEVDFSDAEGRTYAILSVEGSQLLVLVHQAAG